MLLIDRDKVPKKDDALQAKIMHSGSQHLSNQFVPSSQGKSIYSSASLGTLRNVSSSQFFYSLQLQTTYRAIYYSLDNLLRSAVTKLARLYP